MKMKRDIVYIVIIVLLLGMCAEFYHDYRYQPKKEREVKVYYNQQRELNKEIIQNIQEAEKYVYFAIYTFTRYDIKDALLAAKFRGLEVKGIMDREQNLKIENQSKIFKELKKAGIEVYEQDHASIMHLKTLVTEKAYVSGSFNWTSAATNLNDEILEIGRDEKTRIQYENVLKELFSRYKN